MGNDVDAAEIPENSYVISLIPSEPPSLAKGKVRGFRYLTVRHQQLRAATLAEQAFDHFNAGPTYWVIGAGAAGLTFAGTILRLGGKAVVLERLGSAFWNLRGGFTKFIDPHLFTWPRDGWKRDATMLPVFNWMGDFAHHVGSQLAWATPLGLAIHLGVTATYVPAHNHWELSRDVPRANDGTCERRLIPSRNDIVVLATGPGLEREAPCAHARSYWLDDDLERPDPYIGPRHIIVAGAGDGALTELARIRVNATYHDTLKRIVHNRSLTNAMRKLEKTTGAERESKLRDLVARCPPQLPFRSDTRVTWVSPNWLDTKAWPVHQVLAASLLVHDRGTTWEAGHAKGQERALFPLEVPDEAPNAAATHAASPSLRAPAERTAVSVLIHKRPNTASSKLVSGDLFVNRTGPDRGTYPKVRPALPEPEAIENALEGTEAWEAYVPPDKQIVRIELPEPLGRIVLIGNATTIETARTEPNTRAHLTYVREADVGENAAQHLAQFPLLLIQGSGGWMVATHGIARTTKPIAAPFLVEVVSRNRARRDTRRAMGVLRFAVVENAPTPEQITSWRRRGVGTLLASTSISEEPLTEFEVFRLDQRSSSSPLGWSAAPMVAAGRFRWADRLDHTPLSGHFDLLDKEKQGNIDLLGARLCHLDGGVPERESRNKWRKNARTTLDQEKDAVGLAAYKSAAIEATTDHLDQEAWRRAHARFKTSDPLRDLAKYQELVTSLAAGLRVTAVPAVQGRLGAARLFEIRGGASVEESIAWAIEHRVAIAHAIEDARDEVRRSCEAPVLRILDALSAPSTARECDCSDYLARHRDIASAILRRDVERTNGEPTTLDANCYLHWIVRNRWSTELLWADVWARTLWKKRS